MRIKFPVCLIVLFSFWLNLLAPLVPAQKTITLTQKSSGGLDFRISEATRQAGKPPKRPNISLANLSEAETAESFERLAPLPAPAEDDNTAFKTRPGTIKPPTTANIIRVKFPSAEEKKPVRVP